MGVEVVDGHRQVVVRVHQPGVWRDDAVPVGVGVVAGRDLVVVAVGDQ